MNGRARNLDFVLVDGVRWVPRVIFRFYPCHSHMHSFDENLPKSYEDVYKVYYCWAVLERQVDDKGDPIGNSNRIFGMDCDECSAITELGGAIKEIAMNNPEDCSEQTLMSLGQPGSIWEIKRISNGEWIDGVWVDDTKSGKIQISVWNNHSQLGYCFILYLLV